jgi:superfamily I DNA/RNA helicase
MKLGFYTHDQRVYWASCILKARPHIAKVIARRFPEVIVDEAQDTNVWLLYLLDILREQGAKVTLVGDPDQCIYEFSMANAKFLPALKKKWSIPEKPLSKSFRCNNAIANAVRNVGGNEDFSGRGDDINKHWRPFIIRDPGKTFSHSVTQFEKILGLAQIEKDSCAIICRGAMGSSSSEVASFGTRWSMPLPKE